MHRCTPLLTHLSFMTAGVSIQIPFLACFVLGRNVRLLGCSPSSSAGNGFPDQRSLYPSPPAYHQRFPGWNLTMKLKTNCPEPPATEASSRCLCCTNNVRLQQSTISCVCSTHFDTHCHQESIKRKNKSRENV
jgi:hypothetical protein